MKRIFVNENHLVIVELNYDTLEHEYQVYIDNELYYHSHNWVCAMIVFSAIYPYTKIALGKMKRVTIRRIPNKLEKTYLCKVFIEKTCIAVGTFETLYDAYIWSQVIKSL